jgi:hypothetical protein
MARPKQESTKKKVNIRLDTTVYNSIVSYKEDKQIETFTKAVEEVLSYGILYYYTNGSPCEL